MTQPISLEEETCSACNTGKATREIKSVKVCVLCSMDILILNSQNTLKKIDKILMRIKE